MDGEAGTSEPKLTQIESLEALRPYVGGKVYFRYEGGQLGSGKLIWTGDTDSRYYDQVYKPSGKNVDMWRTDVVGLSTDDFNQRLRRCGETAIGISVGQKELPEWRLNAGERPQKVLVVQRDRNKLTDQAGNPVGDHYEILLSDDGMRAMFVRDEDELEKLQVSVEQVA